VIVERSALIAYPREWVYNLVNDVRSYPDFIDGISKVVVLDEGSDSQGDFLTAELSVRKFGVSAHFATSNRMVAPELIQLKLHSGMLKSLVGSWQFTSIGNGRGTKVEVKIEFEAGALMGSVAAKAVDMLCGSVVDNLEKRLYQLHGAPSF